MAVKVTKKQKKLIVLPGEYQTKVYVRNAITNAKYSYSLMQERIFNFVIFYLRNYTKASMDGQPPSQMDLFTETKDKDINITVPLSMLCNTPSYYKNVRKSAQELATIVVMIERKDSSGKEWVRYQGLFRHVDVPKENNRSSTLVIQISKDVAEMLITIDKKEGIPINYTSFLYQVCAHARNKYTPRLYKIISGWKVKKNFRINIDGPQGLRDRLQLGSKYKLFDDIKKRILDPVQAELQDQSDCWFTYAPILDGKKVVGITFTVIDVKFAEYRGKMKDYILYLCKAGLRFPDSYIDLLRPMLEDYTNYESITYKIVDIQEKIRKDKTITNGPAYALRAIRNLIQGA